MITAFILIILIIGTFITISDVVHTMLVLFFGPPDGDEEKGHDKNWHINESASMVCWVAVGWGLFYYFTH